MLRNGESSLFWFHTPSTSRSPAIVQPAQPLLLLHLGTLRQYAAGPTGISLGLPARPVDMAPATAGFSTLAATPGQDEKRG